MLLRSQPLNAKISEKLAVSSKVERESMTERNILSQHIGRMFDDMLDVRKKRKIKFKTRLDWQWHRIKDVFYDVKHTVRNHVKWHKALKELRPWEGFNGLLIVMQTHLRDYILCEQKYGHSEEEFKKHKINTAKETITLLERMKEPDEYLHRRRKEVEIKYPRYKSLITKYKTGGTGSSGDFIAQGNGWVGEEAGKNPRKGYFEFVTGRFELAESPDQHETDRLLAQIDEYNKEISNAYIQAEADSDKDFEKLGQLLKENLYSWWD